MQNKTKQLTLTGLFIALGLILPFFTAQIPTIGRALLPMHIPVLLAGFICGPSLGLAAGAVTPLLRSVLFGTPPLFPMAVAMTFELAAYGFLTGYLYSKLRNGGTFSAFVSLIGAMLGGRIVWGVASLILFGLSGSAFGWQAFLGGAFVNAVPGIILQLVLIPAIVLSLQRSGFLH
ncbi:MAG: ECF transporter S component [Firmicutes bacterium]|nr:ECF transporter S component [Bacillota bacterium]NLO65610.1 ECF transporter S component [Bacillota bacterium]